MCGAAEGLSRGPQSRVASQSFTGVRIWMCPSALAACQAVTENLSEHAWPSLGRDPHRLSP